MSGLMQGQGVRSAFILVFGLLLAGASPRMAHNTFRRNGLADVVPSPL